MRNLFTIGMIWLVAAYLTHASLREYRIIQSIKTYNKEMKNEFGT